MAHIIHRTGIHVDFRGAGRTCQPDRVRAIAVCPEDISAGQGRRSFIPKFSSLYFIIIFLRSIDVGEVMASGCSGLFQATGLIL